MLKDKDLNLDKAKKALFASESLKSTEAVLNHDQSSSYSIARLSRDNNRNSYRRSQSMQHERRRFQERPTWRTPTPPREERCKNCGHEFHQRRDMCPARGKQCRKCLKMGHWASMCLSEPDDTQYDQKQQPQFHKKHRRVIRAIGSTTEYARVDIEGHQLDEVIDTGCD